MKTAILVLIAAAIAAAQTPADRRLFLLIGQSNMAGRGVIEDQDKRPIPHVLMLNQALEWVPAVDPLHFDKPDIAAVGLGRTFAKTLLDASHTDMEIGLIPAAFGGTSLDEWKAGGKLYNDAVKRAKAAMKLGKLRGILWHQGEADSAKEENAATYITRFQAMITQLREDLGDPDVPVVVGQLGRYVDPARYPFAAAVNEKLATIPLHVPHTAFVSSEGLTSNPDRVHFNSASQREFGRRYAIAFLSLDPAW